MTDGKVTLGERMVSIEIDMKHIKEHMKDQKDCQEKLSQKMDKFIESADKKYAYKSRVALLEKIVYGAIGAILLGFMGVLIQVVYAIAG